MLKVAPQTYELGRKLFHIIEHVRDTDLYNVIELAL